MMTNIKIVQFTDLGYLKELAFTLRGPLISLDLRF